VARLFGGFTGQVAGTCAGVQLYKTRRGPGRFTAVRAEPQTTAPRSAQQILYQQRMAEIRRFFSTLLPEWANIYMTIDPPRFGWFTNFFQLIAPNLTPATPFTSFAPPIHQTSRDGTIYPASFTSIRTDPTTGALFWNYNTFAPTQLPTDRLALIILSSAQPWNRTYPYYRANASLKIRSQNGIWFAGMQPSEPLIFLAYFYRNTPDATAREPIQLFTES